MPLLQQLLGCALPIIQAPMAGVQGSAMAIAVSNAGGVGSLPCAMLGPDALVKELTAMRDNARGVYNVNFFCHTVPAPDPARQDAWMRTLAPHYRELSIDASTLATGPGRLPFSHASADVLEAFRPPVVSFHFGLPADDLLARVRRWGSRILSTATTVEEAKWLEARGVDAIIAQGLEAGGHRGMFLHSDITTQVGTLALVPQIVRAVKVPVIAAGGISTAHGVCAAMALGASGVQAGSAYLLCPEATTTALHRKALQSDAAQHTALTNLFTGAPARGIVNRFLTEHGPMNADVPAFPLATAASAPLRAAAEKVGNSDFTPLWAGQNLQGLVAGRSAAEVTRALAEGLPLMC